MPPKKDSFWERSLESLKARNPTWGAGRLRQALEQLAAKLGREDAPGDRWVGNYLNKLKGDHNWPQREMEYREFHWPESMGTPDVPWEACPAVFELLQVYGPNDAPLVPDGVPLFMEDGPFSAPRSPHFLVRPDVRLAKWFWRVTQAIPHPPEGFSPFDYRHLREVLAHFLREWEIGEQSDDELAKAVEAAIVAIRQETYNLDDMGAFWRIFEKWTLREEDQGEQTSK
jgi:hypothetical protein